MSDQKKKRRTTDPRSQAANWKDISHTVPVVITPMATADEPTVPTLVIISGPQMGQVYPIKDRQAIIGRAEDANLWIRDPSISRHHAVVLVDDLGRCRIEDKGSTNGTFVNGIKVSQGSPLSAGDRIQVGQSTLMKLEYQTEAEDRLHDQLFEAGTRDPLTGLFNRRYLEQHLDADVRLAARHGEDLAILLVAVDGFDEVNNKHGHLVGDAILRQMATIMSRRQRGGDILARYGASQFVVISRRTDKEGAQTLAESARTLIADTAFTYREFDLHVTVTVGVASLRSANDNDSTRLLSKVHEALAQGQKRGGNCVAAS